jgi:hypothetical protein
MLKNPTHSNQPLGEFFVRWPLGHGGYARQALSEACLENGVKADKAELIAASLFVAVLVLSPTTSWPWPAVTALQNWLNWMPTWANAENSFRLDDARQKRKS